MVIASGRVEVSITKSLMSRVLLIFPAESVIEKAQSVYGIPLGEPDKPLKVTVLFPDTTLEDVNPKQLPLTEVIVPASVELKTYCGFV